MAWREILIALVSNGILLVVLGFLARSLIQTLLVKDIKRFEAELKAKGDAEIERLKTTLQMAALEHQVRFSKLHDRRAEVIAELYTQLVDALNAAEAYVYLTAQEPDGPTRGEDFHKLIDKLRNFYRCSENYRILLPEHICSLLNKFIDKARKSVVFLYVYSDIPYPTPQILQQKNQMFMDVIHAFEAEIPAMRGAIEKEFRDMLSGDTLPPT